MTTTFFSPPGATVLDTTPMRLFALAAPQAVNLAGILLVDGEPGHGKTCTVETWRQQQSIPTLRVQLPGRATSAAVTQQLLTALRTPHDPTERVWRLQNRLMDSLLARPRILIVDEAQNLGVAGLNQLRHYHDHPDAAWTLVLVGAGISKKIAKNRELVSRISRRVAFGPLTGAGLIEALIAYHPTLYPHAPTDLLHQVDELLERAGYGRGNLRAWAGFTGAVIDVHRRRNPNLTDLQIADPTAPGCLPPLDHKTASSALALLGGTC